MRCVVLPLVAFLVACSCVTPPEVPPAPPQVAIEVAEPAPPQVASEVAGPALEVTFDPNAPYKVARIRFDADVDNASVEAFIFWMRQARSLELDALVIDLHTNGGEVYAGERMAKVIEDAPFPTICVVDTRALSMGFYLLQSCSVRLMTKRSILMAHEPRQGIRGTAHDLLDSAIGLQVKADAMAEHLCARLTVDNCRERFAGSRSWWMDYEEAVAVGAVDGIVPSPGVTTLFLRATGTLPLL